jgi:hypothetical protein
MAVKWFYGASDARLGPYSAQELKELKARGRLQSTDMVWKEGVLNGLPAGKIRGLFGNNEPTDLITGVVEVPVITALLEAPVILSITAPVPRTLERAPEVNPEPLEFRLVPIDDDTALRAPAIPPEVNIPRTPIDAQEQSPLEKISMPSPEPKDEQTVVPERPKAKPAPVRQKRAVVESGAIIISQDGERVRFRKKCVRCAYEDTNNSVMRLLPGMNRQLFFCPKCRKQVGVAIRAV